MKILKLKERATYLQKKAANKFNAKRYGGFGSKLESAVYDILKQRENAGEIRDIKCQQTVVLQGGPREERITWRLDFSYERVSDGELVYVEAKGFPTDVYKMKLKLFRGNPPNELEIYKGTYQRPFLQEKILKK